MPRGGKRQGTPGVGYSNRTDLAANRAPSTASATPASAGVEPVAQRPPPTGADEVPNLGDPTQRSGEPVTEGMSMGPGGGPGVLGGMDDPDPPGDQTRMMLRALVMKTGNLDVARLLYRLDRERR